MEPAIQSLGWFMRWSTDQRAVFAFYRDVVGLPVIRVPNRDVAILWAGEATPLEALRGSHGYRPWRGLEEAPCVPGFRSMDLSATARRLRAGGAKIVLEREIPFGRELYALDPDDCMVCFKFHGREAARRDVQDAWAAFDSGPASLRGTGALPPDLHRLEWVIEHVDNVASEAAFFRDVVGLTELHRDDSSATLVAGEIAKLELKAGGRPRALPNDRAALRSAWMLRVHCVRPLFARLAATGARVVNPLFEMTGGTLGYLASPCGVVFGIQEHPNDGVRAEEIESAARWTQRRKAAKLS